eukprot:719685_1
MEKRLESLGNWIQENGALFGHEIGILGNGLFASKEVLAGKTLIVIPKSLCFTRENVLKPGNCVRLCDRRVPEHEASVASVRHQSRETPHRIRKNGSLPWVLPDGKTQVRLESTSTRRAATLSTLRA